MKTIITFDIHLDATTMTAQAIIATRSNRAEFSSPAQAQEYIWRCNDSAKWTMILGCNGKVWVLSNRLASILVKAGYEYAN